MITILRKHQRVLMLIIAMLTIIAFIWLYNPADTRELGSTSVATIYGRNLSQADIEREVKSYQLALAMGQFPLLEGLGGIAQDENRALEQFIWNRLVIQHQAKALGVEPTDSQVAAGIKAIPAFQSNGQFDPGKYKAFVVEQLGPRGFTELQLENIVRDALRFERLKTIVGAPAAVSEKELLEAARIFEKVNAQEIRFSLAPSESDTNVTDEEVKNFYEQNKPALIMPETRSVEYVKFEIPKSENPLEGRARVDALQEVADAASAFAEQASASSFGAAAQAGGQAVQRSPEFDRSGAIAAGQEDSQAVATDLKNLAPSAFLLTERSPVSDVIQSGDAFFVLKVAQINPQRPLTIEEARPVAASRLGARKAERLLRETAEASLAKIRQGIASGKSFQDAAAEAGLKVRSFSYLVPSDQKLSPEEQEIAAATLLMEPGQLSGMIPASDGGFAVFLSSREPIDEAGIAKKPELASRILETKRRLLFMTWLLWAREAAKITFAMQRQ
ncbi:MAG: SurA N-terminal domain-containing protein [Terrimicrobiaceae bacterium]